MKLLRYCPGGLLLSHGCKELGGHNRACLGLSKQQGPLTYAFQLM